MPALRQQPAYESLVDLIGGACELGMAWPWPERLDIEVPEATTKWRIGRHHRRIGGFGISVIKVGLVTKVGSVAVKVTMEVVAEVEIATSAM